MNKALISFSSSRTSIPHSPSPLTLASLFSLHRCLALTPRKPLSSLALANAQSSLVSPLVTTKNLVVLMALPQITGLALAVATNGLAYFAPNSSGWSFLTVGRLFPALGTGSSYLIARLWKSRDGTAFVDPALAHPRKSLAIAAGASFVDIATILLTLTFKPNLRMLVAAVYLILMIFYIYLAIFFTVAGAQVLRSQATISAPIRTMALYLLATAIATLATLVSFVMLATGAWARGGVGSVFVMTGLYYAGNVGMTMCNLFIFAPDGESVERYGAGTVVPISIGEIGEEAGGGEGLTMGGGTFLETQNKALAGDGMLRGRARGMQRVRDTRRAARNDRRTNALLNQRSEQMRCNFFHSRYIVTPCYTVSAHTCLWHSSE